MSTTSKKQVLNITDGVSAGTATLDTLTPFLLRRFA